MEALLLRRLQQAEAESWRRRDGDEREGRQRAMSERVDRERERERRSTMIKREAVDEGSEKERGSR